jgi:hypothetical protein
MKEVIKEYDRYDRLFYITNKNAGWRYDLVIDCVKSAEAAQSNTTQIPKLHVSA